MNGTFEASLTLVILLVRPHSTQPIRLRPRSNLLCLEFLCDYTLEWMNRTALKVVLCATLTSPGISSILLQDGANIIGSTSSSAQGQQERRYGGCASIDQQIIEHCAAGS